MSSALSASRARPASGTHRSPQRRSAPPPTQTAIATGRTDRIGRAARQAASLRMASSPERHPCRRGRVASDGRKEYERVPKKDFLYRHPPHPRKSLITQRVKEGKTDNPF